MEKTVYILTYRDEEQPRLYTKTKYLFSEDETFNLIINGRVALLQELHPEQAEKLRRDDPAKFQARIDELNIRKAVNKDINLVAIGGRRPGVHVDILTENERTIIEPETHEDNLSIGVILRRDVEVFSRGEIPLVIEGQNRQRRDVAISGNVIGLGYFEQPGNAFVITHAVYVRRGDIPQHLINLLNAPTGVA